MIAQQTVAHGAYPYVALRVLDHVGGDIDAAADARGHRGDRQFAELARLWVHARDGLVEGRDEHLPVVELEQRGDEAEVGIEGLSYDGFPASGEFNDVVRAGGSPYRTIVCLFEIHHAGGKHLIEDAELSTLIATFQDAVYGGEPDLPVTVAEDVGNVWMSLQTDVLGQLFVRMVDEESAVEGGDPEVAIDVGGKCQRAGASDGAAQVAVAAAEFLLIVVVGTESFVVGAEPDVAT